MQESEAFQSIVSQHFDAGKKKKRKKKKAKKLRSTSQLQNWRSVTSLNGSVRSNSSSKRSPKVKRFISKMRAFSKSKKRENSKQ